jgi:Uma2 family endonuclease
MNVALTRSTLAAEGFPRRAFTVDDIRRMVDAGVIREDERIELIEGELVVMAAKSIGHDIVKNAFTMALARAVPDDLFVSIESTIQLAPDILVEPDIAVVTRSVYAGQDRQSFARPRPEDILLLIEVAASSMTYDRKVKARLYARHGIREFWVIDANERATWIHTGPSGDGWTSIVTRGSEEALTTPALPGFVIRLADIG